MHTVVANQAIYKPWEVREKRARVRARPIKKTSDEIIYESVERESELYEDMERHKGGRNVTRLYVSRVA